MYTWKTKSGQYLSRNRRGTLRFVYDEVNTAANLSQPDRWKLFGVIIWSIRTVPIIVPMSLTTPTSFASIAANRPFRDFYRQELEQDVRINNLATDVGISRKREMKRIFTNIIPSREANIRRYLTKGVVVKWNHTNKGSTGFKLDPVDWFCWLAAAKLTFNPFDILIWDKWFLC